MASSKEQRSLDATTTLADLVDHVADLVRNTDQLDLDQLCDRYPEYADELKRLVPAVLAMDAFGGDSNDDDDLPVPRNLGGFRLLRRIGRGGMGVVYLAHQPDLDRNVAIKVLPFAALLDKRQLDRFKLEARAAAMLKHPNIVGVFTFGSENGVHYYVMEYVEGLTLAEVVPAGIVSESDLSPEKQSQFDTQPVANLLTEDDSSSFYRSVARLGVDLARALNYAHRHGVIHRDIKPSNVMLDSDSEVKITDFGLARIHSGCDLTMSGDALGTLRYMSPEQLSDKGVVDGRTDVYSLGLTLYEVVTGRPAFGSVNRNESRSELLQLVLDSEPTEIWKLNKNVPLPLATVIHKAAAKVIDLRYQTAADLADDLQRFLDQRPVLARRPTLLQKSWSWIRRNRLTATAGAVALAALLTLAIVGPIVALRLASALKAEQSLSQELTEEQKQLNGLIYCQEVRDAIEAARLGNFRQAKVAIRKYDPSERPDAAGTEKPGWEFAYLRSLVDASQQRQFDSSWVDIMDVATSNDGKFIAYGNWMGDLFIRRTSDRVVVHKTKIREGSVAPVSDIQFSPDGRYLVVVAANDAVLWRTSNWTRVDIPSDKERSSLVPRPHYKSAQFGVVNDELLLFVGETRANYRTDLLAQVRVLRIDDGNPQPVSTIDDINGSANSIILVDSTLYVTDRAGQIRRWLLPEFKEQDPIEIDGESHLYVKKLIRHPTSSRWLFASTTNFLPECSESTLFMVDTTGKDPHQVIQRRRQLLGALAFHPIDQRLVAGYADGQVWSWKLPGFEKIQEDTTSEFAIDRQVRAHLSAVHDLEFTPDGTLYSVGVDGTVQTPWKKSKSELAYASRLDTHGFLTDMCWIDNQRIVASYVGREFALRLWDAVDGSVTLKQELPGEQMFVNHFIPFPDGKRVAYAAFSYPRKNKQTVGVWDLESGEIQLLATADKGVNGSVALTNDQSILIATIGKKIISFDAESLREKQSHAIAAPYFARIHPTRDLMVLFLESGNNFARLWDLQQSKVVRTLDWGRPICRDITFSPDGQDLIAVMGVSTAVWRDWENSAKPDSDMPSNGMAVWDITTSGDGQRLLISGMDSTVGLRSTVSGNELMTIRTHAEWNYAARFSPDGQTLAYGGGKGTPFGSIFLIHAPKDANK